MNQDELEKGKNKKAQAGLYGGRDETTTIEPTSTQYPTTDGGFYTEYFTDAPRLSNQTEQISNQTEQVSNQVEQVSNQVPQVSDQVPQVSNQVPQVSNQRRRRR